MDDQSANRAGGGVSFRKLRIAWSVPWGVACLLMIALWVRSYSYVDDLVVTVTNAHQIELQSVPGRCIGFIADAQSRPIGSFVRYRSTTPQGAEHAMLQNGVLGGEIAMNTVWVAHGIVAAILAMLCVAPWARYLRFSLRTLLIATALVAVALGVYAFLNRPVVVLPPIDVGDFGREI